MQKLLNREVVAKISITDQDVTDFYNQNRAQFNVAEPQYRIAQIVVTPHPDPGVHNRKNDKAHERSRTPSAKSRLLEQKIADAGADFSQLAMDYSEDSTRHHGRRSRIRSRICAESVRSSSEESRAVDEARRRRASRFVEANGRYRILKLVAKEACRTARAFRSAGAAVHSRHAAQPQGTASAHRLHDRSARRGEGHQLPGAPDPRIIRQASGLEVIPRKNLDWKCERVGRPALALGI